MIITESWFRRKFRSLLIKLYTRIENEGNINFSRNGEGKFLDSLERYYRDTIRQGSAVQLFDVGANKGEFAELLRARWGKGGQIHVFEPVETLCAEMRGRFAGDTSVHINQVGISSTEGVQVLYSDIEGSPLSSFLSRDVAGVGQEFGQQVCVPTIRLDTYIKKMRLEHINFIKIDTEGYEFEVINSLGKYLCSTFIDFVQFEYGGTTLDAGLSLRKFFEIFEAAGFVIAKVMRTGLLIRPYENWMDDFRYANFVAISRCKLEKINKEGTVLA